LTRINAATAAAAEDRPMAAARRQWRSGMDISFMGLGHVLLLFALPAALAGVGRLVSPGHRGFEPGWCGVLFIALCAAIAAQAVLARVAV